MMSWKEAGVY